MTRSSPPDSRTCTPHGCANTVSILKQTDPLPWDLAESEWIDGELSEGNLGKGGLVAISVTADGFREVLGVGEDAKEDKASWTAYHLDERNRRGYF